MTTIKLKHKKVCKVDYTHDKIEKQIGVMIRQQQQLHKIARDIVEGHKRLMV